MVIATRENWGPSPSRIEQLLAPLLPSTDEAKVHALVSQLRVALKETHLALTRSQVQVAELHAELDARRAQSAQARTLSRATVAASAPSWDSSTSPEASDVQALRDATANKANWEAARAAAAEECARLSLEVAQARLLARARARQVVELEQHLARLRTASMATAERAAEVHQQRDQAIASMEARAEAAEKQAAEADGRCKDLEARLQASEELKAAAVVRQASAEEAMQHLKEQLDWQAERIAELEAHMKQAQRVQEAAAKEREALMAQVAKQLVRIKDLEASSTLQKLKVELASCKEELSVAQAALQHAQRGTVESVIPVQSPVGARTFNPVFATEALEGQVHDLQQQLSEERKRSANMRQKLEKATSDPSAFVSPSKQGDSLCSSPWDELLSHDDSNEENVNPLEDQSPLPRGGTGQRSVPSGSPASQSRVVMSSPAKGGRAGSKVQRSGAKRITAECGIQTDAEARDALLMAVQAELARLRDVNERLLASQAAGGEQSKVRAAAASARAACQEEIAALKAEASRLHQQLLSAQQKATADAQAASIEQSSSQQTNELARSLRAAQQQLADDRRASASTISELHQLLSVAQRERQAVTQELHAAEAALATVRQECTQASERESVALQDVERLSAEVAGMQTALQACQSEADECRQQAAKALADARAEKEALELAAQSTADEHRQKIEELQAASAALREELEESRAAFLLAQMSLADDQREVEELQSRVLSQETALKATETKLEHIEKENASLSSELLNAKASIQQIESAHCREKDLRLEADALRDELETAKRHAKDAKEHAEAEVADLMRKISLAEDTEAQLQDRLAEMECSRQESSLAAQQAQQQVDVLSDRLAASEMSEVQQGLKAESLRRELLEATSNAASGPAIEAVSAAARQEGASALEGPPRQQCTDAAAAAASRTSLKVSSREVHLLPVGNMSETASAPASSSQQQAAQPSSPATARLPATSQLTSGEVSGDYGAQLDLLLEEAESLTGALGAAHAEHALPDSRPSVGGLSSPDRLRPSVITDFSFAGASTSYISSPALRQTRASTANLRPVRRPSPPITTLEANTPEISSLTPTAASDTRHFQDMLHLPPGRRPSQAHAEREIYTNPAGVSGKANAANDTGLVGKQQDDILAERSSRHVLPGAALARESTAEDGWNLQEAVAEPDNGRQPGGGSFVERAWIRRQHHGRSSTVTNSETRPELRLPGPTDEACWLEGEGSSCSPGPAFSSSRADELGWRAADQATQTPRLHHYLDPGDEVMGSSTKADKAGWQDHPRRQWGPELEVTLRARAGPGVTQRLPYSRQRAPEARLSVQEGRRTGRSMDKHSSPAEIENRGAEQAAEAAPVVAPLDALLRSVRAAADSLSSLSRHSSPSASLTARRQGQHVRGTADSYKSKSWHRGQQQSVSSNSYNGAARLPADDLYSSNTSRQPLAEAPRLEDVHSRRRPSDDSGRPHPAKSGWRRERAVDEPVYEMGLKSRFDYKQYRADSLI